MVLFRFKHCSCRYIWLPTATLLLQQFKIINVFICNIFPTYVLKKNITFSQTVHMYTKYSNLFISSWKYPYWDRRAYLDKREIKKYKWTIHKGGRRGSHVGLYVISCPSTMQILELTKLVLCTTVLLYVRRCEIPKKLKGAPPQPPYPHNATWMIYL